MFMTIREEFQWEMFPRWQGISRKAEEVSMSKDHGAEFSGYTGDGNAESQNQQQIDQ